MGDGGFSLVEIIVAIGLFSLISLAGFSLVSSILDVRDRTEGRLERLGAVQRALHLLSADVSQARGSSVSLDSAGASLQLRDGGNVRYQVEDGEFIRRLTSIGAGESRQLLVRGVDGARWQVFLGRGGWVDAWPQPGETDPADAASPLALAVEFDLGEDAKGLGGVVRRSVELSSAP